MNNSAKSLLREHGSRTLQYLVDQIVDAVREGNDHKAKELDTTMREVERLLEQGGLRADAAGARREA